MKTRVLYKNRIFINPTGLYKMIQDGAVVNPDLSAVKGIPPHIWVIRGNKVLADANKLREYRKAKGISLTPTRLEKVKFFFKRLLNGK